MIKVENWRWRGGLSTQGWGPVCALLEGTVVWKTIYRYCTMRNLCWISNNRSGVASIPLTFFLEQYRYGSLASLSASIENLRWSNAFRQFPLAGEWNSPTSYCTSTTDYSKCQITVAVSCTKGNRTTRRQTNSWSVKSRTG